MPKSDTNNTLKASGKHLIMCLSKSIVVELNLASSDKEPAQWVKVKLLFVRSVNEAKQQLSKHDWALFLTTDSRLEDEKILEAYALPPVAG